MRRYVILGSGAAGFAAAEAIRSQDHHGEILMISEDHYGYYSRPGLAYLLTGELPEEMLYPVREDYFKRLGIQRIQGRAARINHHNHRLFLESAAPLIYDRLLIATGAMAIPLKAPGADLQGVFKLDSLQDARAIHQLARKSRTAIVVGGGITALELVEGLTAHKVKVHYFLRGDRYWNSVLDETESIVVETRLKEHGVLIHYRTELDAVLSDRKGKSVAGVRTKDGETIRCEMVGSAIGVRPRLELVAASDLLVDRGVLVDEYLRTNAEDVFAAGDVAQVYDPLLGERILDSLWTPARQQGYTAGLNMTGCQQAYIKGVPYNVTRLAGLTTTIIGMVGPGRGQAYGEKGDLDVQGIARGDSETWRQLPNAIAAQSGFDVNRLRILLGAQTLLGALVMGDQTLSQPLERLITAQADISPIRSRLLAANAPLADILAEYYTSWSASHVPLQ